LHHAFHQTFFPFALEAVDAKHLNKTDGDVQPTAEKLITVCTMTLQYICCLPHYISNFNLKTSNSVGLLINWKFVATVHLFLSLITVTVCVIQGST